MRLVGLALSAAIALCLAQAVRAADPNVGPGLLEFLGSVDSDDKDWQDYLAHNSPGGADSAGGAGAGAGRGPGGQGSGAAGGGAPGDAKAVPAGQRGAAPPKDAGASEVGP